MKKIFMSINLSKEKYDASHIQTEKMKECVPN